MSSSEKFQNISAAGQLFGYTLQFPRALCRLIQIGPGGAVGIEVMGDVSAHQENGAVISEEDKSSINGNPLTNRSKDLWKTFYNWIQQVTAGTLDIEKTDFVLYTNQSGRRALVNLFNDSESESDSVRAIEEASNQLSDISEDHEIWNYFNFIVNENTDLFKQVIMRFSLIVGPDNAYDDVRTQVRGLMISHERDVDLVSSVMNSWFQESILKLIFAKEPAIIRHEDCRVKFSVLLGEIRRRDLVDFAASEMSIEGKLNKSLALRPTFVVQLDIIDASDDQKLEAFADYLKADYNRQRWIENETINEDIADDFERRLKTYWSAQTRKVEILNRDLDDKLKGELLLNDCITRQELIRDISPPDRTIAGTYHAIANRKDIGWHPNWKNLLAKDSKDE